MNLSYAYLVDNEPRLPIIFQTDQGYEGIIIDASVGASALHF